MIWSSSLRRTKFKKGEFPIPPKTVSLASNSRKLVEIEDSEFKKLLMKKDQKYLFGASGKPVCTVDEDELGRVFTQRTIDLDKHILHYYDGICYDQVLLESAEKENVIYHRVTCSEWKEDKYALAEQFEQDGIDVKFPNQPPQICLPLVNWNEGSMPPAPVDQDAKVEGGSQS